MISVPYMAFQLSFDFYLNRCLARSAMTMCQLRLFGPSHRIVAAQRFSAETDKEALRHIEGAAPTMKGKPRR